jgi:hypothetical protein
MIQWRAASKIGGRYCCQLCMSRNLRDYWSCQPLPSPCCDLQMLSSTRGLAPYLVYWQELALMAAGQGPGSPAALQVAQQLMQEPQSVFVYRWALPASQKASTFLCGWNSSIGHHM